MKNFLLGLEKLAIGIFAYVMYIVTINSILMH